MIWLLAGFGSRGGVAKASLFYTCRKVRWIFLRKVAESKMFLNSLRRVVLVSYFRVVWSFLLDDAERSERLSFSTC